jgi:hypothetical protein
MSMWAKSSLLLDFVGDLMNFAVLVVAFLYLAG